MSGKVETNIWILNLELPIELMHGNYYIAEKDENTFWLQTEFFSDEKKTINDSLNTNLRRLYNINKNCANFKMIDRQVYDGEIHLFFKIDDDDFVIMR